MRVEVSERVEFKLNGQDFAGQYVSGPSCDDERTPVGYHIEEGFLEAAWPYIQGYHIGGFIEEFSLRNPGIRSRFDYVSFGLVTDKGWFMRQAGQFEWQKRIGANHETGRARRWFSLFIESPQDTHV